ncbi:MAG: pantetheine-phosphate adenylyltransferase [Pseudomonadota bacterium]|jgi:pantetheine-phosphate adenylyltransferase|nr:pantetheine-phosphate adenylyltransferase [Burkholderiales bacterium]
MRKMVKRAVYAGSFDPVTKGHLWIIEQAAQLFNHLIIAIGENATKSYSFDIKTRLDLLRKVTKQYKNVEVSHFHNQFLIHYAAQVKAQYIIRGIRNVNDYEYEKGMRHINSDISKDITTIFLMPPRGVAEISSSLVNGLVGSDQWENIVTKYVPPVVVKQMIKLHQSNQVSQVK